MTKKDFIEKMEKKRISVTDISNDDFSVVLDVTKHYQIYYYEFDNEKEAKTIMKKEVQRLKSDNNKITKKSSEHYDKYEIFNENIYSVFVRVDNTYVFISAVNTYKNDIIKALRYMGY